MSEERCVWLAQCVCPNLHCIRAYANEAGSLVEAKQDVVEPLAQNISELLNSHAISPTCAICGAHAKTWRFKAQRTRFATMVEAMPYLKAAEEQETKLVPLPQMPVAGSA